MLNKIYLQKEVKKMTSLLSHVTDIGKYMNHSKDITIVKLKKLCVFVVVWEAGSLNSNF